MFVTNKVKIKLSNEEYSKILEDKTEDELMKNLARGIIERHGVDYCKPSIKYEEDYVVVTIETEQDGGIQ